MFVRIFSGSAATICGKDMRIYCVSAKKPSAECKPALFSTLSHKKLDLLLTRSYASQLKSEYFREPLRDTLPIVVVHVHRYRIRVICHLVVSTYRCDGRCKLLYTPIFFQIFLFSTSPGTTVGWQSLLMHWIF